MASAATYHICARRISGGMWRGSIALANNGAAARINKQHHGGAKIA